MELYGRGMDDWGGSPARARLVPRPGALPSGERLPGDSRWHGLGPHGGRCGESLQCPGPVGAARGVTLSWAAWALSTMAAFHGCGLQWQVGPILREKLLLGLLSCSPLDTEPELQSWPRPGPVIGLIL